MPARGPFQERQHRNALAVRIVGEADIVRRPYAARHVAFGVTQCHRARCRRRSDGVAAAPSDSALDSPAPIGGAMPVQRPSALMRSSGVTGLSGVSGGVSIETFLINILPDRENQSASLDSRSDDNMSDALPQPDTRGATKSSDINALR